MSGPLHLGIDVGGTASRWVACDEGGALIARGKAGGATAHVFNPAEKGRLQLALQAIAEQMAGQGVAASSVAAGLTGYGAAASEAIKPLISAAFGVADAQIMLVDDMTLAYAAIFAPGAGHLVSAGTGSIGLHIGEADAYVRVGGRGILIDDAGSGSWIALRALDRVFRCLDHSGSFAEVALLSEDLFDMVGGDDWQAVRQFVYGGDRGQIGSLAVAVGKAAARNDAVALTILKEAGAELALLGKALVERAGAHQLGFIGGVLELHPVVAEEITSQLAGHDVVFPQVDAARLAAQLQGATQSAWKQRLLSMPR